MFHGSMVALVTPMHANGLIDYPAVQKLVEWHIAAGTSAIVVAGTTGESATLDQKEKSALTAFVVKQVAERIPVIVGTASTATAQTIALTHDAMAQGAGACLIMTPAYVKPTQEGLYQHYRAIAKAVALPIIMYNVPSRTACDLLPETIARLAEIPNIIGIKEATGDLKRSIEIQSLCGDSLDIYSGDDFTANSLMLNGAKGVISVAANVAPHLMHQLCRFALKGDRIQSEAMNNQLQPLFHELFVESNPIPVKWALNAMGYIDEGIRLPLTQLSENYHQPLINLLKKTNLL